MTKETVQLTVTLEVDKATYEEFKSRFDETSFREVAASVMDDTMEQFNDDPAVREYWLDRQAARNQREAKKAEAKPPILFTLTGEQAREHIENGNILSCTTYTKAEDGEDKVEFYLSG